MKETADKRVPNAKRKKVTKCLSDEAVKGEMCEAKEMAKNTED